MFNGLKIGFAMTGSFCNFEKTLVVMEDLMHADAQIIPIVSENVAEMETRFMTTEVLYTRIQEITGRKPLSTIQEVEPIGPKKLIDIMVIVPCTGNTMAKLANSITDTPVLMACKSHLRGNRPVVLALSTNDGLSGSAKNIGILLNTKNYFFVPFGQDDPINKPYSLTASMDLLKETIKLALESTQIQPIIKNYW